MDDLTIRVLGFKTVYKTNASGKSHSQDMVEYSPISAIMTNRVWEYIGKMIPSENPTENELDGLKHQFMTHRWAMIEPAYKAWKDGQELPVNGTPLGAWPHLTPEMVKELSKLGFKTVEEIAAMTDNSIGKLNIPQPRQLPKQAKLFLDAHNQHVLAEEMATRDEKIAVLEERLEAALELLETSTKAPKQKTPKPAEGATQDA